MRTIYFFNFILPPFHWYFYGGTYFRQENQSKCKDINEIEGVMSGALFNERYQLAEILLWFLCFRISGLFAYVIDHFYKAPDLKKVIIIEIYHSIVRYFNGCCFVFVIFLWTLFCTPYQIITQTNQFYYFCAWNMLHYWVNLVLYDNKKIYNIFDQLYIIFSNVDTT